MVTSVQKTETCRRCGKPIAMTAEPVTIGGRAIALRPNVCSACAEQAAASEAQSAPRQTKWQRLCPALYQKDLPPALQVQEWVGQVLTWQYGPQGLMLVGNTGAGKTWVLWHLVRRLIEEQRSIVKVDAVTFRTGLANAAREAETDNYVRRFASCDVLYWDDFGQTHLSGAASEMLLHVVEQRTSRQRPLLLTSQYRGEALERQFERLEMGAAVRRRINEFCRVVIAYPHS